MKPSRRTTTHLRRTLRRTAACLILALGLWLLSLTSAAHAPLQWLRQLSEGQHFISAVLSQQLPGASPELHLAGFDHWQRLLLSESAYLSGWSETSRRTPLPQDLEEGSDTNAAPLEENEETPPETAQGQIVERSFQASSTDAYEHAEGIYLQNRTSKQLDIAAVAAAEVEITLPQSDQPEILIIHTHGSEAYAQDGADTYAESDTARTTDTQYNIIRVGDEIERIFTEMGLNVLHDPTLYDYPSYNGSYERSRAAVEGYLTQYPSIQIVLDVHRDALVGEDGTVYKAVTEVDGSKTAQVLLVLGTDDSGLNHPHWEKNLTLAMRVQHRMNTLWPELSRPIALRSSRFNQQLTQGSILVEIGSHGNTLQEALAGARLFARSAGQVFLELKR